MPNHEQLLAVMKKLPGDYFPWGELERWGDPTQAYPDCSCGCRFNVPLEGVLGMDWGVCGNPASHRKGLLTFEHQGCQQFEQDDEATLERETGDVIYAALSAGNDLRDADEVCIFCGQGPTPEGETIYMLGHKDDCPTAQARALAARMKQLRQEASDA